MQWITCQNVYEETWRRLLEFANVELAFDEIEKRHGKAVNKRLKSNYIKQAEQIKVALLQAKEYFEATKKSTLFTSPNHLYYGATSLSTACMLLLGDGSKSLDFLRKNKENSHHGLGFTVGANAESAKCGLNLLELSHVEIFDGGHFRNWYETLPIEGKIFAIIKRQFENSFNTNLEAIGRYSAPIFDQLCGSKFSIIELIKYFPDLYSELNRYGVDIVCSRANHNVEIDGDNVHQVWHLHGARTYDNLKDIILKFEQHEGCKKYFCYNFVENRPAGSVSISTTKGDGGFKFPSCRNTLLQDQIYYSDDVERHEVSDFLLVGPVRDFV